MITQKGMKGKWEKKGEKQKNQACLFIGPFVWICSVIKFDVLYGNTSFFLFKASFTSCSLVLRGTVTIQIGHL